MNTPIQSDQQQQQDCALLDEAQRLLVRKIIRQSGDEAEMSDNRMRIYTTAIANFQKIALAHDRLVVSERRIDASYHIAQGRNDAQLEIARIRAEAVAAKRRPDHPQVDEDDPLAPFGRKKDGTPYTEAEFDQSLNEAIRGIWGLKPINPKSYMPWEMKRAPDGTLVAPDDPAVASGAPAERPPDCDTREPPDIADSAPIRVRSASDGSSSPSTSEGEGRGEGPTAKNSPLEDADSARAPSPSRNPFVSSLPAAAGNSSLEIDGVSPAPSSNPKETAPTRYPLADG